jgi:hypothetical protein
MKKRYEILAAGLGACVLTAVAAEDQRPESGPSKRDGMTRALWTRAGPRCEHVGRPVGRKVNPLRRSSG